MVVTAILDGFYNGARLRRALLIIARVLRRLLYFFAYFQEVKVVL